MRLSETGELGLLAELERLGLIEGVHFRLDWLTWRDLGWRAAAVNLSDLSASGAIPEALLVTLVAPGTTRMEDVVELYRGLAEAGVPVVGGDTTQGPAVVVAATALGRSARVPGRAGARPGDALIVTGPLGAAGAAFRRESYARPPLRLAEGRTLATHAHALMDISDGLGVDAGHIAGRSGVRCVLELDRVPLAAGATVGDLAFGEDYELLAAVTEPRGFAVIGHVEAGEGVLALHRGEPTELAGWQHFRA
jgi:thiamine-monophosphate kinase